MGSFDIDFADVSGLAEESDVNGKVYGGLVDMLPPEGCRCRECLRAAALL
jgi:hypothetical protein